MNIHENSLPTLSIQDSMDDEVIPEKQRLERILDRERINLEPHQLVWCDCNVNTTLNQKSVVDLGDLRKIVDYTKLFDDVEECQRYLTKTMDSVTFLVCSAELETKQIEEIHLLTNVQSIYVSCEDNDHHPEWSTRLTKVRMMDNQHCLTNTELFLNLDHKRLQQLG